MQMLIVLIFFLYLPSVKIEFSLIFWILGYFDDDRDDSHQNIYELTE